MRLALVAALLLGGCSTSRPTPAVLSGGAVAAGEPHATDVGIHILRRGGNAVDAAVAVAFALAVTLPEAGNLGGGGFMIIANPEVTVLDYRETAPAAASRDMFLNAQGEIDVELCLHSHKASGVPGTVAGLWEAHRLFGSLPWPDLVAPAIRLAEEGWILDPKTARDLTELARSAPSAFARNFETPRSAGERLIQKDLAATLRRISEQGRDGFYRGTTALRIAEEMRRGGGFITEADLAAYQPKRRAPVTGTFHGWKIVSMPPPSSGGAILIQLLNMVEAAGEVPAHNSAEYLHALAEMMKRAYADRAEHLGDPDFVDIPLDRLISKAYAAARWRERSPGRSDPATIRAGERDHTTHFSIVDRWGHAVSNTTTLNDSYGSRILVEGAGFLLNNEMDDFAAKPGAPNAYGTLGGEANAIAPGKRMLSSMAPTMVFHPDGRLALVLGSPGGPRIITTVLQVILNRVQFGMPLAEAVAAPRFHHQWPPIPPTADPIRVEKEKFPPATLEALRALGYTIAESGPMGLVNAVEMNWPARRAEPVTDPRGIGSAATE
ncbi:MAG: gamma-glutamyltransferase [Planctomycetes bacterium]|nr:gamma-glutamyltransferase [Planctomycetota bacterium]